jgi:site-specific DNA-methyltransferase (adenine-specific)
MEPYYQDSTITLFCGDMRDVLPTLGEFDACVTDPPYGETSLAWDRWPEGWPALVAQHTRSLWCFGSMRMFLDRRDEFTGWRLSQDVVWEKHNGTGFAADRLKRVHELALHWYRGDWASVQHIAPREDYHGPDKHARARTSRTPHAGAIGGHNYEDDGTRMVRSVIKHASVRGGLHPTEKPVAVLGPLIEYAVPPGGVVLDVFAGSGSTGLTARQLGRRAVLIEANEEYCERAAERLSVPDLFGGAA